MSRLYKMDNEIKLLLVIRKKYYVNMQIQKNIVQICDTWYKLARLILFYDDFTTTIDDLFLRFFY